MFFSLNPYNCTNCVEELFSLRLVTQKFVLDFKNKVKFKRDCYE